MMVDNFGMSRTLRVLMRVIQRRVRASDKLRMAGRTESVDKLTEEMVAMIRLEERIIMRIETHWRELNEHAGWLEDEWADY